MKPALRVALLVAAALAVWLAVRSMHRGREAMAGSSPVTSTSAASAKLERTRIDILKDFLGEKWPLIEERLTPEQLASLAEPSLPADFLPCTEVEPPILTQIREGLQEQREELIHRFRDKGGPKDLTSRPLNPTGKELGPKNLEQIQSTVDEINAELEPLAALAFDLLVEVEEAIWDQRLYEAFPFIETSLAGAKERDAQFVILEKWKHGAWTVSYTVDSSEWPTLAAFASRHVASTSPATKRTLCTPLREAAARAASIADSTSSKPSTLGAPSKEGSRFARTSVIAPMPQ